MSNALVLGGGAPNLTLMAGALVALDEKGVEFSVISASGAGMLIGLLYAVPKGMKRQEALKNAKDMGVHDLIYSYFPVNYKVFHKPGLLAEIYTKLLQQLQQLSRIDLGTTPQNLFNDWMALVFSTFCPSDLNSMSKGLCQPAPWVDEVVDFVKLKDYPGDFFINAYNVDDDKMEVFSKEEITLDHFHAGLAFPFIYAPFELNGKTYIEGSAVEPLCFEGILKEEHTKLARHKLEKLKTIVVFDVLGRDKLIREPRNLYDAWVRSIIVPLVSVAKKDTKLFELIHNIDQETGQPKRKLLKVKFTIPDEYWPNVLDWSRSNLEKLFDIGYKSGLDFYEKHKKDL
jgi:NTE family protein